MHELPDRMGELDSGSEIVVYCHHGIRSAQVVALLRRGGFQRAVSLRGGINAWSLELDDSVPRY